MILAYTVENKTSCFFFTTKAAAEKFLASIHHTATDGFVINPIWLHEDEDIK